MNKSFLGKHCFSTITQRLFQLRSTSTFLTIYVKIWQWRGHIIQQSLSYRPDSLSSCFCSRFVLSVKSRLSPFWPNSHDRVIVEKFHLLQQFIIYTKFLKPESSIRFLQEDAIYVYNKPGKSRQYCHFLRAILILYFHLCLDFSRATITQIFNQKCARIPYLQ
jgi:hypothetical protein